MFNLKPSISDEVLVSVYTHGTLFICILYMTIDILEAIF